jgi:hypothetical protein
MSVTTGGSGGSGVVILSIPARFYTGSYTNANYSDGGTIKVLQFNGSGTYTA